MSTHNKLCELLNYSWNGEKNGYMEYAGLGIHTDLDVATDFTTRNAVPAIFIAVYGRKGGSWPP